MAQITGKFIVPAYYADFHCKGGACRHTCCGGLAVNISQEEYFRLLGLPCSTALRSDLDVALKPLKDADPYRYACISPDFFGRCRLLDPGEDSGQEDAGQGKSMAGEGSRSVTGQRTERHRHLLADSSRKGLCRLQEECGAAALPATCRYFPRSPRFAGRCQCAMANACEETLELLYSMKEWKMQEQELTFDLAGEVKVDESGQAQQQRNMHEALVGKAIHHCFDPALQGEDFIGFTIRFAADHWDDLRQLLAWAGDSYESVQVFCEAALLRPWTLPLWQNLSRSITGIRAHYSSFDRFFQLSLINDLFWRFYPYTGKGIGQHEAETVLPYMISMLLVLCAANLNETSTKEDLIDLFAGFYRMVELTPFDHNCYALLF